MTIAQQDGRGMDGMNKSYTDFSKNTVGLLDDDVNLIWKDLQKLRKRCRTPRLTTEAWMEQRASKTAKKLYEDLSVEAARTVALGEVTRVESLEVEGSFEFHIVYRNLNRPGRKTWMDLIRKCDEAVELLNDRRALSCGISLYGTRRTGSMVLVLQ